MKEATSTQISASGKRKNTVPYFVGTWLREFLLANYRFIGKAFLMKNFCICVNTVLDMDEYNDGSVVYQLTDSDISIRAHFTAASLSNVNDSNDGSESQEFSAAMLARSPIILEECQLQHTPTPGTLYGDFMLEVHNFTWTPNKYYNTRVEEILYLAPQFIWSSEDPELQRVLKEIYEKRGGGILCPYTTSDCLDALLNEFNYCCTTLGTVGIPPDIADKIGYNNPGSYNPGVKKALSEDATENSSKAVSLSNLKKEPSNSEKEPSSSEKEPSSSEKELSSSEKELSSSEKEQSSSEKEPSRSEELNCSEKKLNNSEKELIKSEKELSSTEKEQSSSQKELSESSSSNQGDGQLAVVEHTRVCHNTEMTKAHTVSNGSDSASKNSTVDNAVVKIDSNSVATTKSETFLVGDPYCKSPRMQPKLILRKLRPSEIPANSSATKAPVIKTTFFLDSIRTKKTLPKWIPKSLKEKSPTNKTKKKSIHEFSEMLSEDFVPLSMLQVALTEKSPKTPNTYARDKTPPENCTPDSMLEIELTENPPSSKCQKRSFRKQARRTFDPVLQTELTESQVSVPLPSSLEVMLSEDDSQDFVSVESEFICSSEDGSSVGSSLEAPTKAKVRVSKQKSKSNRLTQDFTSDTPPRTSYNNKQNDRKRQEQFGSVFQNEFSLWLAESQKKNRCTSVFPPELVKYPAIKENHNRNPVKSAVLCTVKTDNCNKINDTLNVNENKVSNYQPILSPELCEKITKSPLPRVVLSRLPTDYNFKTNLSKSLTDTDVFKAITKPGSNSTTTDSDVEILFESPEVAPNSAKKLKVKRIKKTQQKDPQTSSIASFFLSTRGDVIDVDCENNESPLPSSLEVNLNSNSLTVEKASKTSLSSTPQKTSEAITSSASDNLAKKVVDKESLSSPNKIENIQISSSREETPLKRKSCSSLENSPKKLHSQANLSNVSGTSGVLVARPNEHEVSSEDNCEVMSCDCNELLLNLWNIVQNMQSEYSGL